MTRKLFFIAVMLFCMSCGQNKTQTATFDKSKIAEEIRAITSTIYQSAYEKDAKKLYSYFSDHVTGVFDGAVMGSWEEHKKEGYAFFAKQREVKYNIDSIYSIDVVSPEVAILTGTYSMSATDTSGNSISESPAWTYVFNKQNGEWKVIYFHISNEQN